MRSVALLVLVGAASARNAPLRRLPRHEAPADYPKPQELFYQQRLDHFNPADTRRWRQRYLLNDDAWDGRGRLANGCRGPVLLYTGNEGPIDAFWNITGFVVQTLAQRLGGLVLFSEQRFYGVSMPFKGLLAEHLVYLTTAQVLADHAEIAEHIKATLPGAGRCPVVAFGGSYGGTLAALLRASHPATVVGSLAASSELGYYDPASWPAHNVDEFTFEDVVVATWAAARPGCLTAVRAAMAAIDAASTVDVVHAFNTCDAKALGPGRKSGFFAYVLEGMPQGDYASAGSPVVQACDELLAAGDSPERLLKAASGIIRRFYASPSCIAEDVGGPGNTPGDGPSSSAWGWQSCTETLHAFSARQLRNFTFDIGRSSTLCRKLYNDSVSPDLHALTGLFGSAYALADGSAGVTRLIWSQGTLDPWHGWFRKVSRPPPHLDVHHFLIEGAAHHEDLRGPFTGDRKAVLAARAAEEAIVRRWVAEASTEEEELMV